MAQSVVWSQWNRGAFLVIKYKTVCKWHKQTSCKLKWFKCVINMCFSFYFHLFKLIYKIISPFHFVFCYFCSFHLFNLPELTLFPFFPFACLCIWCKFLYLWCYFSSMSANTRSRFILCSTSSPRSEPGTGRTWWCLDCGRMRCSTRSANPICDFMFWSIFFLLLPHMGWQQKNPAWFSPHTLRSL